MKVMAINSSLRRGGQSRTELMLDHLIAGIREAGAEVEVVHLRDKMVKDCLCCYSCMTRTPGRCTIKDDMTGELFPMWLESDLAVYASPLFHYTFNAVMKRFIERTWPSSLPFIIRGTGGGGEWTHPRRNSTPAAVVLSACGFAEPSTFDALSHYVNFLFGRKGKLVAEIYRPASHLMTLIGGKRPADVLDATRQAGREIVQTGKVSAETIVRISQPLADLETFATTANLFWKRCIEEGITPKEFEEDGHRLRIDSLVSFMVMMPLGLNSKAAEGLSATIQFDFSGGVEGSCHFILENGAMRAVEGPSASPDLTISTSFDLWTDIMSGKTDGARALMEGQYQASGDMSLLVKMGQLFETPRSRRHTTIEGEQR